MPAVDVSSVKCGAPSATGEEDGRLRMPTATRPATAASPTATTSPSATKPAGMACRRPPSAIRARGRPSRTVQRHERRDRAAAEREIDQWRRPVEDRRGEVLHLEAVLVDR